MEKPRLRLVVLALISLLGGSKALSASCALLGNPRASEVEILECVTAQDYFESHYEQLHPSYRTGNPDPKAVFEGQLKSQPGVVLRVKLLRFREYTEPQAQNDRYRWAGQWQPREPVKEAFVYLRQESSGCDSVSTGAKTVFIAYPQCCDTGYFGEIGCHLDLGMMQALPADLQK